MGIISQTLKLKRVHPIHYWIRILCFAFSVVFLALWAGVLTGDVRADVEIFDIQSGTADLPYMRGNSPHVAICPSGRFYFPFIDLNGNFNVSWSDDNRSSWDSMTIQSDGWKGETKMIITSIQSWVNNTTVILMEAAGADRAYDLYLFWLWGENNVSDPTSWNYTQINAGGTAPVTGSAMIFNRTGMLHIVWSETNAIRHSTWDVTTGDVDLGATIWKAIASAYPMIQCDYNNNVWIAYESGSWYYIQDWDDVVSLQTTHDVGRLEYGAFFIASDNKKILTGHRQYLSNHAVAIAYETTINTTMGGNTFQNDIDAWSVSYWSTGNIVGTTVSICLLRLETGSEEYVSYTASYDAVDAVWEGSEKVLWAMPTDNDEARHFGTGPNSIWPKLDGSSVSMLTSGEMYYWMWKDELGGTDDYYEIVYSDAVVFPWWDWSAPEEPDPDPDPDGNGNGLGIGEICSSNWLILLVMLVMLIAIVGMAAQIG